MGSVAVFDSVYVRMRKNRTGQKHKLDKIFSKYVRLKNADKNGYNTCASCGKREHWKDMDAGHFVSRNHYTLRWDERNVWPQCKYCNRFRNGNIDEYAIFMIDKYGPDILKELNQEKHKIAKYSQQEYEDMIAHFTEEIDYLENGTLRCPYCDRKFKSQAGLTKHLNASCG